MKLSNDDSGSPKKTSEMTQTMTMMLRISPYSITP